MVPSIPESDAASEGDIEEGKSSPNSNKEKEDEGLQLKHLHDNSGSLNARHSLTNGSNHGSDSYNENRNSINLKVRSSSADPAILDSILQQLTIQQNAETVDVADCSSHNNSKTARLSLVYHNSRHRSHSSMSFLESDVGSSDASVVDVAGKLMEAVAGISGGPESKLSLSRTFEEHQGRVMILDIIISHDCCDSYFDFLVIENTHY